jgi:hypothetical protein
MTLSLGILPPHRYGLKGAIQEFEAANYHVIENVEPVLAEIVAAAATDWCQHRRMFVSRIRLRGIADHVQQ